LGNRDRVAPCGGSQPPPSRGGLASTFSQWFRAASFPCARLDVLVVLAARRGPGRLRRCDLDLLWPLQALGPRPRLCWAPVVLANLVRVSSLHGPCRPRVASHLSDLPVELIPKPSSSRLISVSLRFAGSGRPPTGSGSGSRFRAGPRSSAVLLWQRLWQRLWRLRAAPTSASTSTPAPISILSLRLR